MTEAAKAVAQMEKEKMELEISQKLLLLEKQNALSKLDRDRELEIRMKAIEAENRRVEQQMMHAENMKKEEFRKALEQAKFNYEIKLRLSEIDANRQTPVVQTTAFDKKYNPRLPHFQESDSLPIYLSRFFNSMKSAQVPEIQWIIRLRDLLTGKLLKAFRDLSETDKLSFETVKQKLMASQNLTAEHYRMEFSKASPALDRSFSDFITSLKTTFDRMLQLSHVTSYQGLYDLMIKNKVYQS